MKIIFGLGNPGSKYENNYHNLGFMALDVISQKTGIVLNKKGRNGVYGEGNINGEKVFLVKPQTYMNNSGECVSAFMAFYKCPIEDILVMYDDIDIDKGALRFRPTGSSGTHNGMRSICSHIGDNFKRLRIGAKNTNPNIPLIDYVLMNMIAEDKELVRPAIEKAGECGVEFLKGATADELMAKFNRRA
ncbi:MAG: aminoacyl-tRNA hydrolase [Clostridiales bacterium]|nr:aminoacyl-tRNA hydrolase [Clostridiales bacterium]